jgi:hypothetical protein
MSAFTYPSNNSNNFFDFFSQIVLIELSEVSGFTIWNQFFELNSDQVLIFNPANTQPQI